MSVVEVELGRIEGERLLRNPALWVALGLTAWWTWTEVGGSGSEKAYFLLTGYSLLLPGFVVVIHTIMAVQRARTAGAEELLRAVPVAQDRRTVGHGVSALAGGLVGVATIAAIVVALRPGTVLGPGTGQLPGSIVVPRPNVAQLLQGPLAMIAVTAFVIALVRWVPSRLVLGPLSVLVLFQGVILGVWFAAASVGTDWLFPLTTGVVHGAWIGCGETDPTCKLPVSGFDRATPWWHLAYLAVIAVFFVAVAVLRHRQDRTTWSIGITSLAAVVALAIVQVVVAVDYVAPVIR